MSEAAVAKRRDWLSELRKAEGAAVPSREWLELKVA